MPHLVLGPFARHQNAFHLGRIAGGVVFTGNVGQQRAQHVAVRCDGDGLQAAAGKQLAEALAHCMAALHAAGMPPLQRLGIEGQQHARLAREAVEHFGERPGADVVAAHTLLLSRAGGLCLAGLRGQEGRQDAQQRGIEAEVSPSMAGEAAGRRGVFADLGDSGHLDSSE